jgi:hypothetical protein
MAAATVAIVGALSRNGSLGGKMKSCLADGLARRESNVVGTSHGGQARPLHVAVSKRNAVRGLVDASAAR